MYLLWKSIKIILVVLAALVAVLGVVGLATKKNLPDNSGRTASTYLPPKADGVLGQAFAAQMEAQPGKSGIYPLADGRDAFLARLALAEAAQYSLDLQYYIWHDDISGRLLAQSLLKAAERGVRVRLLLDDHTMAGMDPMIATLNHHPNIEVRLFNPYMQRSFRPVGYLSDFFRLNRRMHNKSFTADSMVSIVGGRNIGDEYFGASEGVLFADLDVAATGEAAHQVSVDFDRYWNSEVSFPAENIIGQEMATLLSESGNFPADPARDEATQGYLKLLAESAFARHLREGSLPLVWVDAQVVSDRPEKALGNAPKEDNLFHKHIAPLMAKTERELLLVSPYFVPTRQGEAFLSGIAQQGKAVHILTNTLAANDVAVVHSGYAKYRQDLLEKGVKLYELKPEATVKPGKVKSVYDGSGASLHAKTFSVDGRYLYVGSFNFDPRSANLNSEMGVIIDHPELAAQLRAVLEADQLRHAYAVSLNEQGKPVWQTRGSNGEMTASTQEPEASFFRRAQVWVASKLPIEWLL